MSDLLKRLCEAPGVSGFEDAVQQIVIDELTPCCDRVWRDRVGNVIALKRNTAGADDAPRVMLAAHVDEIGLMVNHIDDEGFVRFVPVGGFTASTLLSQRVIVHGREPVRGVIAPRIQGTVVDMGAYESPVLFVDDFESGDTSSWSATFPGD